MVQLISVLLAVLVSVAFFSLFERKVMSFTQSRKGPAKVSLLGFFQPFADALKLILKLESNPFSTIKLIYFLSPIMFFSMSCTVWCLFCSEWVLINFFWGILFCLLSFGISSYGVLFSGWFSNSKYATLGCGRILAQSVSYEIGLSSIIVFLCSFFCSTSLEFYLEIQEDIKLIFPFFFVFILFTFSIFAELNRSPFDLAEGESELVSGYSVEYGGVSYTLIFLSENCSLIWSCYLLGVLFSVEITWVLIFSFVFVRATLPRVRFDKMMFTFWSNLLPIILIFFIFLFSMS